MNSCILFRRPCKLHSWWCYSICKRSRKMYVCFCCIMFSTPRKLYGYGAVMFYFEDSELYLWSCWVIVSLHSFRLSIAAYYTNATWRLAGAPCILLGQVCEEVVLRGKLRGGGRRRAMTSALQEYWEGNPSGWLIESLVWGDCLLTCLPALLDCSSAFLSAHLLSVSLSVCVLVILVVWLSLHLLVFLLTCLLTCLYGYLHVWLFPHLSFRSATNLYWSSPTCLIICMCLCLPTYRLPSCLSTCLLVYIYVRRKRNINKKKKTKIMMNLKRQFWVAFR